MCIIITIFVYRKLNEMRTNVEIDDELMDRAMCISKAKTKKETIHKALEAYIRLLKRKELLKLKGQVQWEGNLGDMRSI